MVALRRLALVIAATSAAVAVADGAPAAPEREMVIRMGKGIGKIERGMTLPQVRRALGGPHVTVYRRVNFGARGRYVELGWELPGRTSWEPVLWQVGFRSVTRRGPLRVTRIATTTPKERTPAGIGVGSRLEQLLRAYPKATCVVRAHNMPYRFVWIVVQQPRGGMTAFNIVSKAAQRPYVHVVSTVMVQRDWFSKGAGHDECPPGWERGE